MPPAEEYRRTYRPANFRDFAAGSIFQRSDQTTPGRWRKIGATIAQNLREMAVASITPNEVVTQPSPPSTFGDATVGQEFYFLTDTSFFYVWVRQNDIAARNPKNGNVANLAAGIPIVFPGEMWNKLRESAKTGSGSKQRAYRRNSQSNRGAAGP